MVLFFWYQLADFRFNYILSSLDVREIARVDDKRKESNVPVLTAEEYFREKTLHEVLNSFKHLLLILDLPKLNHKTTMEKSIHDKLFYP